MDYIVHVEDVAARNLAAVRATATRANLGSTIVRSLDQVWPVVRRQQLRAGHNVVLYLDGVMTIEAGVEVSGEIRAEGAVRRIETPAGQVATTTYFGDYAEMGGAHAAVVAWCREHGRRLQGPSWEVYGDWHDDPRQLRTDIYYLLAT